MTWQSYFIIMNIYVRLLRRITFSGMTNVHLLSLEEQIQ